jgi:hypothetical protein
VAKKTKGSKSLAQPRADAGNTIPNPRDYSALQNWFAAKPLSWSIAIAARLALRAMPWAAPKRASRRVADTVILPLFRAIAIARFAAVCPTRAQAAAAAAKAAEHAAVGVSDVVANDITAYDDAHARVARAAAHTAADAAEAIASMAIDVVPAMATARAAAYVAEDVARAATAATSAALEYDCSRLVEGQSPQQLGHAKLWFANPPRDVLDRWRQASRQLRALGGHWGVWVDWYDAVLAGSPPAPSRSEAWEMAYTDVEEPLPWEDGALAVNMAIIARLAKLATSTVPAQSPAPIRVEERAGKIGRVADRGSSLLTAERDFDAWRTPVVKHIQELASGDFRQGTNHSRARDRLVALERLMQGSIWEVKEQQFRIGYEIERLEGLVTAYRVGADDMPILNAATLEDLGKLSIALKMGIDKLERWNEFRQRAIDDPAREASANRQAVAEVSNKIADEMERNPDYFHPELPASFRFLAEAVRDPKGATKVVVYGVVKSAENVLAFLGQRALGIGAKTIDGAEQGISKAVAASLLIGLSSAALQLSGALPLGLAWLKPLLETVARMVSGG